MYKDSFDRVMRRLQLQHRCRVLGHKVRVWEDDTLAMLGNY